MISLLQFEQEFFSRMMLVGGHWEMSPFEFAKEIGYEGSHAQEMILHWAQRGLIELRAYDGQFKDWKSSYEYTPESAVFIINHGVVRIDLRARGEDHAKLLTKRPMGFVASV